ncbi:MAG: fimbrillin family protein [Muribaculaceae bacterium]|nr:fimbrillin family protein [Muribaculaceae bacterium]
MKKIYIISALSLLGLVPSVVSCSSDEDISGIPQSGSAREIRFATETDLTRAHKDITATNLATFNVYAYTSESDSLAPYMDNVVVTKSANNVWTYSPVKYWPANNSLDFYAFSPADWVGSNSPLRPVSYDANPYSGGMKDIVYAVCSDIKGNLDRPNPQVMLNFRHALSKLTLKLSSNTPNVKVEISSVALSNVKTKGNFLFPKETTSKDQTAENTGKWTDQNDAIHYNLLWPQATDEFVTLTSTPTVLEAQGLGLGGDLYVIPQTLSWANKGAGDDDYIMVVGSIFDAETGDKLWPSENTPEENLSGNSRGDGTMKFPLTTSSLSEWQPGYHYIYSLVINVDDQMGAIQFGTPSVDSYVEVTTTYE